MAENIWDRQQNEGRKPYNAFCIYRDLGPGRSIGAVCKTLSRSYALLHRWKTKWDWENRADAFDGSINEKVRDSLADLRERLLKRQNIIALKMQFKILKKLKKMDFNHIDPVTLGRWFETLN